MNRFEIRFLQVARKVYSIINQSQELRLTSINDANIAGNLIKEKISSGHPFMLSRFGAVEISALVNYLSIKKSSHNIWHYIKGEESEWWWNERIKYRMENNAGFFPATDANLVRFCNLMLEDMCLIDILASWQPKESLFIDKFPNAKLIGFIYVDPYWADEPWTQMLEGKKVLVVHPFSEEIEFQYKNNRRKIHSNISILPEFQLITLKAVQSIGGNSLFQDWFEALDYMKEQINGIDFDICLLGCGAYGMPLAAYVKRMGKIAIHFGGSLQLLFGIRGKRWETPYYGYYYFPNNKGLYPTLMNEYWIRPYASSKFAKADQVENGCYW